jgi:hypothetical protein
MHLVTLLLYIVAMTFAVSMALWNLGFLKGLSPPARVAGIVAVIALYVVASTAVHGHGADAWGLLDNAGAWLASSPAADAIASHANTFTLWSLVMLVACVVAALRLVTFRRGPSRHRMFYAWLSWMYVVALTAVAIKIACGVRPPPGPIEAIGCVAIAALFIVHQGNLAHLHRAARRAFNALVFGSAP